MSRFLKGVVLMIIFVMVSGAVAFFTVFLYMTGSGREQPLSQTMQVLQKGWSPLSQFAEKHLGMKGLFDTRSIPPSAWRDPSRGGGAGAMLRRKAADYRPIRYRNVLQDHRRFLKAKGIQRDAAGNLYITNRKGRRIRIVQLRGKGRLSASQKQQLEQGKSATIQESQGMIIDRRGNIYVIKRQ